jgi:hypothetical protein
VSRFFKSLLLVGALIPLASCSVFYPNWGATGIPETEITLSPTTSESQSESASPSEEPSESATATETATATPTPTQQKVSVEILFAMVYPDDGVLEVVAQVPNLSEQKGECVLTLSGPVSVSVTVPAEPSSDFMQCQPFDVELLKLSSGSYQAVVEYDSASHAGTSAAYPVEVP